MGKIELITEASDYLGGKTPWYNTSHESPSWDHCIFGELEVVELNDFELEE